MKIYFWKEKKNFGDLLSSLLLKRFANLDSEWSSAAESEIVVVGSILEHLPKDWSGIVAGAGRLHEASNISLPNATILGVRGPMTARGLCNNNCVWADPGLLADEIVSIEEKQFDLGIIPHWTDKELELNPAFTKWKPNIIRVSDDPVKTMTEIGKCRKIVSSSLHGIILADAFGIPRRIEIPPLALSKPNQEGGLFKWRDYASSLGMKLQIGLTQEANRNKVVEKQHELFDMFEEIKSIFQYSEKHKISA
jgi:pyruvyltransferase